MFHGRNIAVVVVALCLVSMSFLSTHVTFQGNTGTVPVLQLRIEELERELASRQKCPQAAPEDHESGRSKSSEVNGQIEVIAQLEAKVETLRHSLLNECSNGRALWTASLGESGSKSSSITSAIETTAIDNTSQLSLPATKIPLESARTTDTADAAVDDKSKSVVRDSVNGESSDLDRPEDPEVAISETLSTTPLDQEARLGSEYDTSSDTAVSDSSTLDAATHKPEVLDKAEHDIPKMPVVSTPPIIGTAPSRPLASSPAGVPPISIDSSNRGINASVGSSELDVGVGTAEVIEKANSVIARTENRQAEREDAFSARDDDRVASPTHELSKYNAELLHRFASSAANIGGEGKNGTLSLLLLSGHRNSGAQNDTAQRYADAVGEIGLRLTAAEAARSRAETEAALLAETSARLLGQAIEARENLVEARREAKQWETKALEASHLAARLATQKPSDSKAAGHPQHASDGSSSSGSNDARGLSNNYVLNTDGKKHDSAHEHTFRSSFILGSPNLGLGRAARHLYLSRAHVEVSFAWRNLGLDAVPANHTAKFKAPCWYPNQHLNQRHSGSSSSGGTTISSSSASSVARPLILGHSRRLFAANSGPSSGLPPPGASASVGVSAAAVGKGLKCLPYFYIAGPNLRSVALLRLLEQHPEVVPTEPSSSGDTMLYPQWWLHSTTSSAGAHNNTSSITRAVSATSHALMRFSNASKAVQRAYNLGGRQRFFGEAAPSMLTRLVTTRSPTVGSKGSGLSPLRPLLPEMLHAAQGGSRLKVVAVLRDPSWVAASALLDAILTAHAATLAPGTGFYLPRDLPERLIEGAKSQLAAFDACVGAPASAIDTAVEAGAAAAAGGSAESTGGKVTPEKGVGSLHVGMPADWPRTDWNAEPSEVLRCAFGGGDTNSRDGLPSTKGSTNNKQKGSGGSSALVNKEEELLEGGWPGGGLYARAAEIWWAGSPRSLLLLPEDDVASLLAFFEQDPSTATHRSSSSPTSSGAAVEASKEVLKKVLTHLDLSKTAMPSLLAAAGLQQESSSQLNPESTASSSASSSKGSETATATAIAGSSSKIPGGATSAAVAAAVLKKKRRSAIMREHGALCLGLYRRWFASHNRELASLTGDARYLEWNNKDYHLKSRQTK